MSNTPLSDLKNQAFWSRMAKNSIAVQRMPAWMKGSPVNKRVQIAAKITDSQSIIAKAAASPKC